MAEQALINTNPETKPIEKGRFQNTALNKEYFTKRGQGMWKEFEYWKPQLQNIQKYLVPTRGFFTDNPNDGKKIDHAILIDSHGTQALDVMASGMLSGLSSKSRPWFRLSLDDLDLMEYQPVKEWLDDITKRMYSILARSNVYGSLYQIYKELASFGTACAFMEQNFQTVMRLRTYTAGEYALSTNSEGMVNGFYRKFWMTLNQLVNSFGKENISPSNQSAFNTNQPDNWIKVNLLIEENDSRVPFFRDYRNMAYRSIYWEDSADATSYLHLGGFEEFPLLCPRWETTTTADVYGRSPGWHALGDIKMLQQMQKDKFVAIAKSINPPLQKDSSVIGDVNNMPGGITTFNALLPNAGLKPAYQVTPDIQEMEIAIEKTKAAISRYFFADLFLMFIQAEQQGRDVTATEVMEKHAEKMVMLGPLLDSTEEGVHTPLITRLFNIMERNGLIKAPPLEIQGMDINIVYISILAQAQKMADVAAIDQWELGIAQEAGLDSSVLDIIDFDQKNRIRAEMLGVPSKIVRDPDKIAEIRKARAQAQAEAVNAQKMSAMAEMAAKGSKAVESLGKTPMGEGSALDSLTGTMRQG